MATEATRNWVLLYLPTSVAIFLLPFCSTSLKRYSSGRAFPFRADTTELPLLITGHHQTAVALRACVVRMYLDAGIVAIDVPCLKHADDERGRSELLLIDMGG